MPIEVKSEQNINGKSFSAYNKLYNPDLQIRYSEKNFKLNDNMLNIPIFLVDWSSKIINMANV